MILQVDSTQRLFFVTEQFNMGRNPIVCNLEDLPKVCNSMKKGVDSIKEMWNGKLQRISKKNLKDMLEAHKMETDFLNRV